MIAQPTFFPESGIPLSSDDEHRCLQKIAGSIYNLSSGLVSGGSDQVVTPTKYTLKKVSTSFVRPSDANIYAIGDAVTNSTTAPSVFELDFGAVGAVAGQGLEIRKIAVVSSVKQSVLPFFTVFLSPTTFTATNDNAALAVDDATVQAGGAFLYCDFQNFTANNSRCSYVGAPHPLILTGTKLYGTIQASNAYTPASGEQFNIVAWVALL